MILDNGGSVACWVWWANLYAGGIVSPTVDYRPPGTSAIAFVLKGPVERRHARRQRVVQHVLTGSFRSAGPRDRSADLDSGRAIAGWVQDGTLMAGNSQLYVATTDRVVYAFGFPMDR